jgi:hypothetical protein
MARTVSVKLEALVEAYKRSLREASQETGYLIRKVDDLGQSSTTTGRKSDDLGGNLRGTARDAASLKREIGDLERSLAGLAAEFAVTSSAADRLDLTRSIKKQQGELRQLLQVKNLLPEPDGNATQSWGRKLFSGISSGLEEAASSSSLATAGTALGLAIAPTAGAAVAGAIVGGAGVGGVVGGLLLAAQDPRVKQAGAELGQFALGDLEARAQSFVPAALDGIAQVRKGFAAMGPDLDRVFASSRFVAPLVDGAVAGAQKFVHGFADAVEHADPVIQSLRAGLDQIGGAAGQTFTLMSSDAKIGAESIDELTSAVTNFITVTGGIVHGAAAVKGWSDEVDKAVDKGRYWIEDNSAIADAVKHLGGNLDLTADGFRKGSVQAEAYRRATLGTATAADFATLKTAGMSDAQITAADASGKYREQLSQVAQQTRQTAMASGLLVATSDDVTTAQKAATAAQQAYTAGLDSLSPRLTRASQLADGLRKATQQLYGAQISATDANEGYEASWDSLTTSVKTNKRSLDIHTASGRANRDALEALVTTTNDAYFADIAAGTAIDAARKKHDNRIKSIKVEAHQLGLDKGATDELITTYGKIPSKKQTDVLLTGITKIANTLFDLYIYQRSLAEGIPLASARAEVKGKAGPAKGGGSQFQGLSGGGYTGDGGKYEPKGVVHGGEWVIQKESTSKIRKEHPGLLEEMNATGQVKGYADGGLVPVEQRGLLYRTNMAVTKVPTKAQVASKVAPAFGGGPGFGHWPSSPAAQRGDSGVWRSVVALIKSTGPLSGSFGNAYRPGDPLWHGSGRAVDWMGFNQDALATFLAGRRPLELIHRTNKRDYAYTRGVNKGSFNNTLMQQHRNHVHIAMANGGVIQEPVFGVGASGDTYSFGEGGRPETVLPGVGPFGTGGGTNVTRAVTLAPVININGQHISPQQIASRVNRELGALIDQYARGN